MVVVVDRLDEKLRDLAAGPAQPIDEAGLLYDRNPFVHLIRHQEKSHGAILRQLQIILGRVEIGSTGIHRLDALGQYETSRPEYRASNIAPKPDETTGCNINFR
jgi:hypothetical protein